MEQDIFLTFGSRCGNTASAECIAELQMLQMLQKNKSVQLKYARLASLIEMWIDDGLLDALTHLQIDRARRGIKRAIT